MKRHLLSIMILLLGSLLICENQADPSPQFYSSYYQPIMPLHQLEIPAPYYQPFIGQYISPEEMDHEYLSMMEQFEEEENPFAYNLMRACPTPRQLSPCTCFRSPIPGALVPGGNINCPAMTASATQIVFSRIPARLNLKTVTLSLPRGANKANSLPASFLANYPAVAISIANPNDASCIDSSLLSPCTCAAGTITCPATATIAQIQAVFNNIAPNTNLGDVVLNLPAGDIAIPTNMLGSNAANTIQLVSSAANNLSKLSIATGAFTSSASTDTQFWIVNFDVVNVDYIFLTNFNALTTIAINKCANPPSKANPPKNLPANLPKLTTISVDGTNIKA